MNDTVTSTTSADEAQREIAEEFAYFSEWSERYQYLIDLGRQLPPFPEESRTEAWRVHGCQSMVWLVPSGDAARMHFEAASDSAIVSGLIALVLRVYSDMEPFDRPRKGRSFWREAGMLIQRSSIVGHAMRH